MASSGRPGLPGPMRWGTFRWGPFRWGLCLAGGAVAGVTIGFAVGLVRPRIRPDPVAAR